MFRKSRTDQAKAQVQDAASTAGHHLREKVAPAVGAKARDAKDWAAPHVERGLEAAAPKVEAAVEKVTPAVDAARDKIVDDLLPRLVEAVNAAAAAGAAASTAGAVAKSRSGDAVSVLKGDAVAKPKRRGRKFLLFTALAAAIGAGVAVFKKQQPREDPWAVPAGTYPGASTSTPMSSFSGSSTSTSGTSGTSSSLGSGAASSSLDASGDTEAEVAGLTPDSAAAAEAISESAGPDKPADKSLDKADDKPKPKPAAKKSTPPKS